MLRLLRDRYYDWREAAFDRKYGIETCGVLTDIAALGGTGESVAHGNYYEPIQLPVFRRIVRALPLAPARLTFVDYGSGKGRALLLAAQSGFRRAIGIEYAPRLHEAAGRNVASFLARSRAACPIELHCRDATGFEPPHEDVLCFFYNPFDEQLMRKVLANIGESLRALPRRLLVAYRNPRHPAALAECGFLRRIERNASFEIYANDAACRPAAAALPD
jgi:SAM-dependent methyltransferase